MRDFTLVASVQDPKVSASRTGTEIVRRSIYLSGITHVRSEFTIAEPASGVALRVEFTTDMSGLGGWQSLIADQTGAVTANGCVISPWVDLSTFAIPVDSILIRGTLVGPGGGYTIKELHVTAR